MKLNPFKKDKNTISDLAYKRGKEETEQKLKADFEDLKQEIINSYEEKLNKKDLEIMLLNTQLKNWQTEHSESKERLKNAKAKEAENGRELYRIEKFKENMITEIQSIMADQAERFQPILKMIGHKELEGSK